MTRLLRLLERLFADPIDRRICRLSNELSGKDDQ